MLAVQQLPSLPKVVRACELMHGADDDFIINAYIALQHQWPDVGGFAHYQHLLRQRPDQRVQVLRDIAASRQAQRCGTTLIDDLPANFPSPPPEVESTDPRNTTLILRLTHAVNDAQLMREMASKLTVAGLSDAVTAVVECNQINMATFESRLSELSSTVEAVVHALRTTSAPVSRHERSDNVDDWIALEIQRLSQRVLALEQLKATQSELAAMARDISDLRKGQHDLHRFTTVDLKREIADYVHALSSIARAGGAVNDAALRAPLASYG